MMGRRHIERCSSIAFHLRLGPLTFRLQAAAWKPPPARFPAARRTGLAAGVTQTVGDGPIHDPCKILMVVAIAPSLSHELFIYLLPCPFPECQSDSINGHCSRVKFQ